MAEKVKPLDLNELATNWKTEQKMMLERPREAMIKEVFEKNRLKDSDINYVVYGTETPKKCLGPDLFGSIFSSN